MRFMYARFSLHFVLYTHIFTVLMLLFAVAEAAIMIVIVCVVFFFCHNATCCHERVCMFLFLIHWHAV